jgi:hypothetical protein
MEANYTNTEQYNPQSRQQQASPEPEIISETVYAEKGARSNEQRSNKQRPHAFFGPHFKPSRELKIREMCH